MSDEQQQIRDLIECWAIAVHDGDHIDAYRETWPGFFQWQASGAVFEIESLDVTAGADVAFALRCCGAARLQIFSVTPNGDCG
jgi:hypothetical protein